jgi:hypothetical protein
VDRLRADLVTRLPQCQSPFEGLAAIQELLPPAVFRPGQKRDGAGSLRGPSPQELSDIYSCQGMSPNKKLKPAGNGDDVFVRLTQGIENAVSQGVACAIKQVVPPPRGFQPREPVQSSSHTTGHPYVHPDRQANMPGVGQPVPPPAAVGNFNRNSPTIARTSRPWVVDRGWNGCKRCWQADHTWRTCPPVLHGGVSFCAFCLSDGHVAGTTSDPECPLLNSTTCSKCQALGHTAIFCPRQLCGKCGAQGHPATRCRA